MAPAAGGTHFLGAEPFHHVAGVSSVPAGQTEVGGAPHSHVADGTLECKAFADSTLNATHLSAAVAAVDPELCKKGKGEKTGYTEVEEGPTKCTTMRNTLGFNAKRKPRLVTKN